MKTGCENYLNKDMKTIAVIDSDFKQTPVDWCTKNQNTLDEVLSISGGILFRHFDIHSTSEFNKFSKMCCPSLLDYTFRSSPRTNVGGKIFTSTEYPADRHIPLHNENSYTNVFPQRILFYAAIAPTISGGETPVVDSRRIYQELDNELVEKFEKLSVLYVRNFMSGIDLSWQEVFQTSNVSEVEAYCQNNNIECIWGRGLAELTIKQVCPATKTHPATGEKTWFNQAHLFHFSSLPLEQRSLLLNEFGESNLPRNAYYGDGSSIELDVLQHIQAIYDQEKIEFKWESGDILLLDNMLIAHGRNPFKGDRKILVAMG